MGNSSGNDIVDLIPKLRQNGNVKIIHFGEAIELEDLLKISVVVLLKNMYQLEVKMKKA